MATLGLWRARAEGRLGDEVGGAEFGVGVGGAAGELGGMGTVMGLWLLLLLWWL